LEPPVSDKCNCHEWEEVIPEFLADFDRVHKLDAGGRMELAREATAVRATGEAKASTPSSPPTTSLVRC
jgi:hypothetical protein